LCFLFDRQKPEAVGKLETSFWFSTLPSAFVVGAVEMWESHWFIARFPTGS
jgi:hypothetical protein